MKTPKTFKSVLASQHIRLVTLICATAAATAFLIGCENKDKRCESRCPKCDKQCDFPHEQDKHTHPIFDDVLGKGTKLHKCGAQPGDHAWDFNGNYVGQFYRVH